MERKFKVTLSEEELKAVIDHNVGHLVYSDNAKAYSSETSARIHDLTKRLNKTDVDTSDAPKEEGWT